MEHTGKTSYGLQRKRKLSRPWKKEVSIRILGLSHTFWEGEQEKGLPQHMHRGIRLTVEQQRNRTVWMMLTRTQEKDSEQERQPVKAG